MYSTTERILHNHGLIFKRNVNYLNSYAFDWFSTSLCKDIDFIISQKMADDLNQLRLASLIVTLYEYLSEHGKEVDFYE